MGALRSLRCAGGLADTVHALYLDTIGRMETALQAACADFKPGLLCKVGHIISGQGGCAPPAIPGWQIDAAGLRPSLLGALLCKVYTACLLCSMPSLAQPFG